MVRRPRRELAGAWRRRTGAERDGAESLNIQTRRNSLFILLVWFVPRKEKRKAATPPAGWVTPATPASKNVDLPPGNPFISPLFLLPLDLVLICHVLQLQKYAFSMLLSRSEAQSLEILCSALSDISSD